MIQGHYNCTNINDPACCSGNHPDPRCEGKGGYFEKILTKGKKYLLRLVNASAEAMFVFSIDGHTMQVISNDLVPIVPYTTDSLFVGIGQRYEVIVEAKPDVPTKDGNYWIRTYYADGCGNFSQPAASLEKTGIIRYNPDSKALPTSAKQDNRTACLDEPMASLVPVVPWKIDPIPQNNITDYTFEAGFAINATNGYVRWALTNTPLYLDFATPTILNFENKTFDDVPSFAIIDCKSCQIQATEAYAQNIPSYHVSYAS